MLILWPDGTISTDPLVSGSKAAFAIKDGFKSIEELSLDNFTQLGLNPNTTVEDVLMQLADKWSKLQ